MPRLFARNGLIVATTALFCVATTGCATVNLQGIPMLDSLLMESAAEPVAPGTPICHVIMKDSEGKVEHVEVPVTESTTVQQALNVAKAPKRFHRMDVRLLRKGPSSDTGAPTLQTMQCNYNHLQDAVTFETDYSVRPDDRIVAEEVVRTGLDDMLDGFRGPFNLMSSRQ